MGNVNTKAAAKLEQRETAKNSKASAKQKKYEDEYWDGVKQEEHGGKKNKKKEEKGASKEDKDAKRAEARQLAKQEELEMLNYGKKAASKKKPGAAKKVTKQQLEQRAEKKKEQEAQLVEQQKQEAKNITTEDEYASIVDQKIDNRSTDISAQNIDDAVAAAADLNLEDAPKERQIGQKAAFSAYEEAQMPIMKSDFPGLKRSQYKEKIFQQWQKAPENPRNQEQ